MRIPPDAVAGLAIAIGGLMILMLMWLSLI